MEKTLGFIGKLKLDEIIMTDKKLPKVDHDGVLTDVAIYKLPLVNRQIFQKGDSGRVDCRMIAEVQHGVDLAHEAEAVAAAVKTERERVLAEVRKAVESTTRLSLIGCRSEDYNHPAFLAGAKCQVKAILEKIEAMV